MIRASFSRCNGALNGFSVKGHSGYADAGNDIVCAAVSAMTMLTVNLMVDGFGLPCRVEVDEGRGVISLSLERQSDVGEKVLSTFMNELAGLADEYPQNILVKE